MTLDEYQQHAMSFRMKTADEAYALFGLVGEVGELYGYIAKQIRDTPDTANEEIHTYVKKELGDILWMISAIAVDHGLTLSEVAVGNIQKLSSRAVRGTLQGSGDDR